MNSVRSVLKIIFLFITTLQSYAQDNFLSELKITGEKINHYWIEVKDYEAAFEQYRILEALLEKVSSEDFPDKAGCYAVAGNAFYFFKDYPKAIYYFSKALSEKENNLNMGSLHHARNGLGLCFRDGYRDYDRSDSCFLAIIQRNRVGDFKEDFCEPFDGMAQGNIGYNMLLRGDYDGAITWLQNSLSTMVKYGDLGFAAGVANDLADCYLRKGDLFRTKLYIDLAGDYCKSALPRYGRLIRIYEIWSRYYTAVGNAPLSLTYLDSTLQATKQLEEEFNAMLLLRMEQKESAKQHQELAREQEVRRHIQIRLLIISTAFILLAIMSVLLYLLFRSNRAAYRALVRKSREWALVPPRPTEPDAEEISLMQEIERVMLEDNLYRDTALSVDVLAHRLGTVRHHVSMAINHCLNKSFSTFINEYRVKEVIRLMSQDFAHTYTLESLAFEAGFNDPRNFYRVFKKITGLSPAAFRKNIF
ncbi:MAG: helix-turn-helix domain-containing protein [Bacteroidetes bacterium]|nr:helix-turn-helix domain-containing protein [Bacteroidota bacterium]